jgi:hypothetical protein
MTQGVKYEVVVMLELVLVVVTSQTAAVVFRYPLLQVLHLMYLFTSHSL